MSHAASNRPGPAPGDLDDGPLDRSGRRIRVLVVDDHPAVRAGLVQLLEEEPDLEAVGSCATAVGALALAETESVDVAVVDHHLGGRDGLWLSHRLMRISEPPLVIIYSAYASSHLAANGLVAGADAVLSKGGLGSELCETIRLLAHGRPVPLNVPGPLASALSERLDEAERPIFSMLLEGLSRPEIDRALGISEDERRARETSMLSKLAPLPGELPSSASASASRGPALVRSRTGQGASGAVDGQQLETRR